MQKYLVIISIFSWVLASCGPQLVVPQADPYAVEQERRLQQLAYVKESIARGNKLENVAFPILTENHRFCEQTTYRYGLNLYIPESIPNDLRQAFREIYGTGSQVIGVVPGSPAARAGVVTGQTILFINGKQTTQEEIAKLGDMPTALFELSSSDGSTATLEVNGSKACNMPVLVGEDPSLGAYADGKQVTITHGMLRFVRDDNELAVIVGHEMTHNILGHTGKKQGNAIVGGVGGLLLDVAVAAVGVNTGGAFTKAGMEAGGKAFSQAFELESDYLGIYMAARAGYDIDNTADLWRRMALESSKMTDKRELYTSTHPGSAERFVKIQHAVSEIRKKQEEGEELLPELMQELSQDSDSSSSGHMLPICQTGTTTRRCRKE